MCARRSSLRVLQSQTAQSAMAERSDKKKSGKAKTKRAYSLFSFIRSRAMRSRVQDSSWSRAGGSKSAVALSIPRSFHRRRRTLLSAPPTSTESSLPLKMTFELLPKPYF